MGPKLICDEEDMEASQYFPDNIEDIVGENYGYALNYEVELEQENS